MVVKWMCVWVGLVLVFPGPLAWADAAQDQLVEQGVALYDDEEYEKAKEILLPLAEAGHAKAMNMVGMMHNNTGAFPNDSKIECDWYERSAKVGYLAGMYNLSSCFNQGRGRPINMEEMLYWRTKAANKGYIPAMINLSSLDKKEGEEYRSWMNKAAQAGSVYAKVSLKLQGYEQDVPDLHIQDTLCVYVRILILGGKFRDCD